jgi:hypothetical protein
MEILEHDMITDINPIDIAETLAERREWDFDRVGDDQIAFAVEGSWRTYSLTMAWCSYDETLRLICSFEMNPPEERLDELYRLIERANDASWGGMFNLWRDQKLMVYRYGLVLSGEAMATPQQVDAMMRAAVEACERFYPAFQVVAWGDEDAGSALGVAMGDAVGRA